MKRSRKRYSSEAAIIRDIDSHLELQKQECAEAERLDALANASFAWCALQESTVPDRSEELVQEIATRFHEARNQRDKADKLRKRQSAHVTRLERLKRTLAAFRTQPMPFCDEPIMLQ